MSIGKKLAELREIRGVTQQELADELAVNRSLIAQIERDTKGLSLGLWIAISRVLNCKRSDIFERLGEDYGCTCTTIKKS